MKKTNLQLLMGAAFLMATSAIGPGFLTQTTVFTSQLLASFGFVILMSIVLDIGAQLNVWRVIGLTGKRGQDIANMILPGLGYFVALLIVLGGLAFNIGNLGGAGLGINAMTGGVIANKYGAIISALIAICIFLLKDAGKFLDKFLLVCGFLMIFLTLYVAISSKPPLAEAVHRSFIPVKLDKPLLLAIVTLVGGTVGGYITFAGGHRLVDAGVVGKEHLSEISKSAVIGISVTGIMRIILFLAALGIVSKGLSLDMKNPAPSVFNLAVGAAGGRIFGVVMWAAAVSSVIGAAYTSVSFIRSFHKSINDNYRYWIIGFIVFSLLVFEIVGNPVNVLIVVGGLNGLILPITLGVMLIAANSKKVIGDYKHPIWMTVFGGIVVIVMAYLGATTFYANLAKLFSL